MAQLRSPSVGSLLQRVETVRWKLAIDGYIRSKGYGLGTLAAFSGEVSDPESSDEPFTEASAALNPGLKTNRDWHFISGEEKTRMAATAMNVFADRSVPIRQSLGKSRSAVPRPPGKGHRVGARVNAVNADKRASELATFVAALRSRLPEGVALSPAELGRALNEAGIKPARAAKWTYQTAKDLLKRIGSSQMESGKRRAPDRPRR